MQRQSSHQGQVMPVNAWLFILLVLCWMPLWAYQMQIRVSADAVWLTEAARRALAGYKASDMYFENNPPLCYLIYIPVVFLMKWGMSVWNALSLYTGLILTASFALNAALLKRWPGMTFIVYWGILSSWLFAVLALTHLDFAQKDHFIALALLPFMLGQLLLTYRVSTPRWLLVTAFLFGLPFILIKPHFGLMPVLMLGFRAWKQRRINVVFDIDFIVLACGVIAYAVIIAVFFMDYIHEILPFGLMYVFHQFPDVYPIAAGILIFTTCCLGLATVGGEGWTHSRVMAVFLSVMSFVGGVIFLIQLKGFHLHLFPAFSFLFPALVTTALLYFPGLAASPRIRLAAGVIVVFAGLGYCMFLIHPNVPTHKTYAESSMAQYLKQHAAGSSFYLQVDSGNVIAQVSAYTGIPIASRFQQMWFFPALEEICEKEKDQCRNDTRVKDISVKIAEDIGRWKPTFIGLYANPGPGQHFLKVVGSNPSFQKEWRKYRRHGQFVLNYREFSTKPLSVPDPPCVYDIYVRE